MTLSERLIEEGKERDGEFYFKILTELDIDASFQFSYPTFNMKIGGSVSIPRSDNEMEIDPTFHVVLRKRGVRDEKRQGWGEEAEPFSPIVRETDSVNGGYITVHYQDGHYDWWEYNFRVGSGNAYLSSKTTVDDPYNGFGWVPPEVVDAIQEHHPDLEVLNVKPPWWDG